ncbi:MAG: DUF2238 domain-containing protein [Bacteroidales bacterium]|jgi:putative membrane protein|nr:DUF2238 domain-containing protein [Bacteroidales bacterium]
MRTQTQVRKPFLQYKNGFLFISFLIVVGSFLCTRDMLTWFLEIFPIIIGAPLLYVTYEKFRFSSIVYFFVLIHFVILAVGSIYTYAEVPLGFWMQDWFGFERNNYDKIGHFAQGFVPALIARELLLRTSTLTRGKWLNFIVPSICLAISAVYELIEWWVAILQGASSEAFLGTQGYEWDTQSDMFFALIGAVLAIVLFRHVQDKQIERM